MPPSQSLSITSITSNSLLSIVFSTRVLATSPRVYSFSSSWFQSDLGREAKLHSVGKQNCIRFHYSIYPTSSTRWRADTRHATSRTAPVRSKVALGYEPKTLNSAQACYSSELCTSMPPPPADKPRSTTDTGSTQTQQLKFISQVWFRSANALAYDAVRNSSPRPRNSHGRDSQVWFRSVNALAYGAVRNLSPAPTQAGKYYTSSNSFTYTSPPRCGKLSPVPTQAEEDASPAHQAVFKYRSPLRPAQRSLSLPHARQALFNASPAHQAFILKSSPAHQAASPAHQAFVLKSSPAHQAEYDLSCFIAKTVAINDFLSSSTSHDKQKISHIHTEKCLSKTSTGPLFFPVIRIFLAQDAFKFPCCPSNSSPKIWIFNKPSSRLGSACARASLVLPGGNPRRKTSRR